MNIENWCGEWGCCCDYLNLVMEIVQLEKNMFFRLEKFQGVKMSLMVGMQEIRMLINGQRIKIMLMRFRRVMSILLELDQRILCFVLIRNLVVLCLCFEFLSEFGIKIYMLVCLVEEINNRVVNIQFEVWFNFLFFFLVYSKRKQKCGKRAVC